MAVTARLMLGSLLLVGAATVVWGQDDLPDAPADENQPQEERRSSGDGRYVDWRRQQAYALPTQDAAKSAAEPRQVEPRPARKLPVRFEQPADDQDSHVRQVSANLPEDAPSSETAKPRELRLPASSNDKSQTSFTHRARPEMPSVVTLVGSLGVVAGLFMIVAWTMRRGMPKRAAILPHDVLEVLGRQRLTPKQEVQLVRVGNKLVLLSVAPNAIEPLSEITDAEEVDRLADLCYHAWSHRAGSRSTRATARMQDKLGLTGFNNTQRSAKTRSEFNG